MTLFGSARVDDEGKSISRSKNDTDTCLPLTCAW